ncbi:hypothetical protein HYG81_05825 [Natrinema zhouii]|uniref:Halobacterial output domain-containing protein n=1 Tax=Natrinema zhouii TaxID=1710539 RepID=A0A7D6GWC4_9EURY|nr:HalOD1 output domain-containing protein [Natrinema zhouii]QLK27124.1 hypothetical protein HYG81_05825 [Natrinema zhouii]
MSAPLPTSIKVVQGVAAHEGIDPTELEPPLHAVIDTDALDTLFRPVENATEATAAVEFSYRGNHVRVDSAGHVDVTAGDTD